MGQVAEEALTFVRAAPMGWRRGGRCAAQYETGPRPRASLVASGRSGRVQSVSAAGLLLAERYWPSNDSCWSPGSCIVLSGLAGGRESGRRCPVDSCDRHSVACLVQVMARSGQNSGGFSASCLSRAERFSALVDQSAGWWECSARGRSPTGHVGHEGTANQTLFCPGWDSILPGWDTKWDTNGHHFAENGTQRDTKGHHFGVPCHYGQALGQKRGIRAVFSRSSGCKIGLRSHKRTRSRFAIFAGCGIILPTSFQPSEGGDMVCARGPLGAFCLYRIWNSSI